MKQRGDKLLLKGSFRVLPSSSSVKSLNSARGSSIRFLPAGAIIQAEEDAAHKQYLVYKHLSS